MALAFQKTRLSILPYDASAGRPVPNIISQLYQSLFSKPAEAIE
jgi:hypothetical protein